MQPLVIIHGWSDEAKSFERLGHWLKDNLPVALTEIRLGDWISMHDDVTIPDVAAALQRAWQHYGLPQHGLPRQRGAGQRGVDVVVHSTGALVVREWMTRYYPNAPEAVPIHRLLMLAPANFGSPLAHKGHSFIGRVAKGWNQPGFQTGKQILKALELASPYTWQLAQRDLFAAGQRWYGVGRILCTVLVGDTGYDGISSIANEDGSDGTVRISTANLNAVQVRLELDEQQKPVTVPIMPQHLPEQGETAFGVVAGENHSTIAFKNQGKNKPPTLNPQTPALVKRALQVTDADWPQWLADLPALTQAGGKDQRFQNTVVRLRDQLGHDVSDYFVEFYRKTGRDDWFEQRLYERVIRSVHACADDPSYRALYLNINQLDALREDITQKGALHLSFLASPSYDGDSKAPERARLRHPVGYQALAANEAGGLRIEPTRLDAFFDAHRTVLVDAQIHRSVDPQVFAIKPLPQA